MDKFLETCKLPKHNHEDAENILHLNRLITTSDIEAVIKELPAQKKSYTGELQKQILPNI